MLAACIFHILEILLFSVSVKDLNQTLKNHGIDHNPELYSNIIKPGIYFFNYITENYKLLVVNFLNIELKNIFQKIENLFMFNILYG